MILAATLGVSLAACATIPNQEAALEQVCQQTSSLRLPNTEKWLSNPSDRGGISVQSYIDHPPPFHENIIGEYTIFGEDKPSFVMWFSTELNVDTNTVDKITATSYVRCPDGRLQSAETVSHERKDYQVGTPFFAFSPDSFSHNFLKKLYQDQGLKHDPPTLNFY